MTGDQRVLQTQQFTVLRSRQIDLPCEGIQIDRGQRVHGLSLEAGGDEVGCGQGVGAAEGTKPYPRDRRALN